MTGERASVRRPRRRNRPLHPKVAGAAIGSLIVGTFAAVLARRGIVLTVDEVVLVQGLGAGAGGWLKCDAGD